MSQDLPRVDIGVIGGSGLYKIREMTDIETFDLDTPYGKPSSSILVGKLHGERVAFIARHDVNHRFTPSEVPFAANIYAMKMLGVKYLLGVGAVGSLRQEVAPQHLVVVDQFLDRTKGIRRDTFFGNGVVAHVGFGDPVCPKLSKHVFDSVTELLQEKTLENSDDVQVHMGGTYVCMEGPAFSTRSESEMYRLLNGTVIGMTCCQEAKLAREAEIAYSCIATVTDYDCWNLDHGNVTVDMVLKVLHQNGNNAQKIVSRLVQKLSEDKYTNDSIHHAMKYSILTPLNTLTDDQKNRLGLIIQKYL
jgi:5'-methylthioadenosine phosphorylase